VLAPAWERHSPGFSMEMYDLMTFAAVAGDDRGGQHGREWNKTGKRRGTTKGMSMSILSYSIWNAKLSCFRPQPANIHS